jgi:hypothetical protein
VGARRYLARGKYWNGDHENRGGNREVEGRTSFSSPVIVSKAFAGAVAVGAVELHRRARARRGSGALGANG